MDATPTAQFHALADPTRRGIFEQLLREGEQTVRHLTDQAGVSQPAVSKHLKTLKEAGLVIDHPRGRETHYQATPEGLTPIFNWVQQYAVYWQGRLDALEDVLDRMED
ncbi:ArsR/SmtB family transcription factor [Deinococcus cellulosilyticus]|uniref:Transcriptional regulator n=1 Tax=Deinococcus cellulosilyticus (strain DSM 18568 / NBRC 106333 / KACC 11606 / 5516J-15) TaxID=1223518 RepID=A0A511N0K8_DEIC1|nr:metalloregulator ArsR/SmtB family transcription factor [Deinococcus cellulosilyticus]GEM46402.1 transcriptional regulator [Deinococcus cellulosilyticus NBRC 106333 = KACC 11606]